MTTIYLINVYKTYTYNKDIEPTWHITAHVDVSVAFSSCNIENLPDFHRQKINVRKRPSDALSALHINTMCLAQASFH